jgi:hypothetical protein
MSLINEALKKAQRTRDPSPPREPVSSGAEFLGERVPRRGRGMEPKTTLLIVLATVGACSLAGAAAYLLLADKSNPIVPAPTTAMATLSVATPPASDPVEEPTVSLRLAPVLTPAPAVAPAVASPVTPAPVAAAPTVTPAPESAPATVMAAPPAPAVVERRPVPSVPTLNPEVVEFLDRLRIAGVRPSATDPKVLMNDRVYRQQDIVNRDLGLRITGITESKLTFVDESGYVYTRPF